MPLSPGCGSGQPCQPLHGESPSETEQDRPVQTWCRHLSGPHWCCAVPSGSPFFVFEDGSPLTRERLVAAVRSALSHAGVNTAHYSGHSFRVGAATAAARAGLQEATIKMLGRWESSAYERYVRMPRESLAAISRQLSQGMLSYVSLFVYGDVYVYAGRYTI